MTKIRSLTNVIFLFIAIIFCAVTECTAALSDKQLCYDPNCSEPISLAKTILAYNANDREVLSFNRYVEVKVFSKGAGKRTDLWGVEINGQRGFAPQAFLNEYKILRRDLSYEVPVYKSTGDVSKIQHKDKLESKNDKEMSVSAKSEESMQKSVEINVDSTSSLYEVIDGTTFYFENKPSIQPSLVSEVVHATAFTDKQTPSSVNDPKADPNQKSELPLDGSIIQNDKKLQLDTNNMDDKLNSIKSPMDIHEEINTEILLEGSEAIINSTSDTMSKSNTAVLEDNESKDEPSEDLSDDLEYEEESTDNSAEENIEDKKQEVEEEFSEGILASFTKTFNILSYSKETATEETENIQSNDAIQNNNDISASIAVADASNTQLSEQTSEEVENTEETIPKLDSNVDSTSREKLETQQKIAHEDVKVSDEETKMEKEVFLTLLENATSLSDVPSVNNSVHEDTDKSVKESPAVLLNANSYIESTLVSEISSTNKIAEDIGMENATAASGTESTISSESQDSTVITDTVTTQSSIDTEQKFVSENNENLENKLEDVNQKEMIIQGDEAVITEKILKTDNLLLEETATESLHENHIAEKNIITDESNTLSNTVADTQFIDKSIVHNVNKKNLMNNLMNAASSSNVPREESDELSRGESNILTTMQSSVDSSQNDVISEQATFNEIQDQNFYTESPEHKSVENQIPDSVKDKEILSEYDDHINSGDKILHKENIKEDYELESKFASDEMKDQVCSLDHECITEATLIDEFMEGNKESEYEHEEDSTKLDLNYWMTLMYVCVTAFTSLAFTLGYYYIENIRRDRQFIEKINKLEKELLVSTKECEMLSETLKSTKEVLIREHCEMTSLETDLKMAQDAKAELEDQVAMLDKELENATEAGLELERMLREVLSSNHEVNPFAQSVEDLQRRLDAQHTANESLTNELNYKAQQIVTLSTDLTCATKKCEELEIKILQEQSELSIQKKVKNSMEQTFTAKIHDLEERLDKTFTEKNSFYKKLKDKEMEVKELIDVINQIKSNKLDLDKLYDVSCVKSEAMQFREERNELQVRLNDVEGAHQLLEEHMKLVKEEVAALSDQCKIAEKEKKDAETRLEVLSKFFQEKEAERQKEEAIWLQKQGEVVSTVERIHTMQNEIQNYKQQVEMLKREIVDQEREYKNQISALETKTHEQWVAARQNERRLEESKAEASQLRNRLTLVEKNLNDTDSEVKLHRSGLEANGETVTSPPLFVGAESSNSPVMFSSSSGVPPPLPPSFLHCFPYLPPLPPTVSGLPPYDISQRPPPLGARLSSPPPMPPPPPPPPLHPATTPASTGRYENAGSPPPPMSPPHLLPPYDRHRSPPPPPFGNDHIPPPPLSGTILPPPLSTVRPWGEDSSLPPPRNSGYHPHQREQPRARNHKGSLHSSGESLDKVHHGKV